MNEGVLTNAHTHSKKTKKTKQPSTGRQENFARSFSMYKYPPRNTVDSIIFYFDPWNTVFQKVLTQNII